MSQKEKIVWSVVIFVFAAILIFFFWNRNKIEMETTNNHNFQKKAENRMFKNDQKTKNFYFHPKVKSLVLPKYQNFWHQERKKTEKNSFQWTIGNHLDYYWPNWSKYFIIEDKTLQRKINKVNIIWYQPKEIIKNRQFRQEMNWKKFTALGITAKKFQTTKMVLTKLINLIRNKNIVWKEIEHFIRQHFVQKQQNILKKVLQNNIWSLEWTDFYPELS